MGSPSLLTGSTPTVLLVHGAFTDASSFSDVIADLQSTGIEVAAPANPLRGLAGDAAYLAGIAGAIDAPVVLAGAGYGGAVVTVAATHAGNVVALVYVAACALDEGESWLDVAGRFPESLMRGALRPATFVDGTGQPRVELYLRSDAFARVFAADLPLRIAAVAAAAQRPIAAAAFEDPAPSAAWHALPSWFLVATDDRIIDPGAQRFMAARAGAEVVEVRASHAVALGRPGTVAQVVRRAAMAPRP